MGAIVWLILAFLTCTATAACPLTDGPYKVSLTLTNQPIPAFFRDSAYFPPGYDFNLLPIRREYTTNVVVAIDGIWPAVLPCTYLVDIGPHRSWWTQCEYATMLWVGGAITEIRQKQLCSYAK